jgi:hypothetical protein
VRSSEQTLSTITSLSSREEPLRNKDVPLVVSGSLEIERKSPTEPATGLRREKRTGPLGLRIAPSLKAAVEKAARAHQLSVSSFVEKVLIERLRNDGFLKKSESQPLLSLTRRPRSIGLLPSTRK